MPRAEMMWDNFTIRYSGDLSEPVCVPEVRKRLAENAADPNKTPQPEDMPLGAEALGEQRDCAVTVVEA